MLKLFAQNEAAFSPSRQHRYALWEIWTKNRRYVNFIGLNPSTADETQDDPTVRRMKGFARAWGYGGIYVTNIFAYRSTNPKGLRQTGDPVGSDNDRWIRKVSFGCTLVVPAWGNGSFRDRSEGVLGLLGGTPLKVLGLTKAGQPRHPLYVKGSTQLEDWRT